MTLLDLPPIFTRHAPLTRGWLLAVSVALALTTAPSLGAEDGGPGSREVSGRVSDAVSGEPIAAARVRANGHAVVADGKGRFVLTLAPGPWTIEAEAEGYAPRAVEIGVSAATPQLVELALFPSGHFQEKIDVLGRLGAEDAPATIPVKPSQVLTVAGGGENVFRVIQTLPGVAGADEFGGRFSVRGGGPDQNLTVMDGVEVHNPYRLFGLVSAFNPETVDSFELTAGAFGAQYGDRLSSLLVVESRPGSGEKAFTGSAALSLTDANAILEGRLPKDAGSWLITGRRTYYDLIGERFTDVDLPGFDDIQSKTVFDLGQGRRLELLSLRSRENTDATFDIEEEGAHGSVYTRSENDLLAVSYRTSLGEQVLSRTILSGTTGSDVFDFGGDFRNESRRSNAPDDTGFATSRVEVTWNGKVEDLALRQELSVQPSPRQVLELGFEIHRLDTHIGFTIPAERNPHEANASSLGGGASLPDELDSSRTESRLGAWVQDRIQVGDRLMLEPGLRLDHATINEQTSVSPRMSASFAVSPSTRMKLGFGLYTQSPGYEKLIQSDYFMDLGGSETLALDVEKSLHFLASLERDLAPGVVGRAEVYYKDFDDLIIGRLETPEEALARVSVYDFPAELAGSVPSQPIITTLPTNDGLGHAYGFDLYVAKRATSADTRLTGWASYTFGIANHQAYGREYPFDYDRRHAFSAVGSLRLGRKLELSATARMASGFPRTPVQGLVASGVLDPTAEEGSLPRIVPERDPEGRLVYTVDYGGIDNLNSARLPFYARLDARATYTPDWGRDHVKLYLDFINVLNRHNAGMIEPTLEYDPNSDTPRLLETEEAYIPFLPSLGIHVSFSGGAPRGERSVPGPDAHGPTGPWAVAGRLAGTQGLGLDITRSLGSRFNARFGFGVPASLDLEETVSDTDYDVQLGIGGAHASLDWYPFGNGFHLSAGAAATRKGFDLVAVEAASYQLGGLEYPAEQVGSLRGEASLRRIAPYLTLGWGNAFGQNRRYGWTLDLGVAHRGLPTVVLNADGPAASDPGFQQSLELERLELEEHLEDARWFPVLSLTFSRRF